MHMALSELQKKESNLSAHYRVNKDCGILFLIAKYSPKMRPSVNCDTWRDNRNELNKHLKYHCRLTNDEKDFSSKQQCDGKLKRINPNKAGLSNCELVIGNNSVIYDEIC